MKRILSILFFTGLVFFSQAQVPVDAIRERFLDADSKIVMVAAHRAAHLDFPENSLPAIQEAIRIGVDIVELDVKVTKDGIPILMHDGTINRTTTGTGKPSDFTLEELRQFRLVHQGETTDELIPTFEEALMLVKNKVLVDIDIKTDQLDPIIDVIKKLECEDQVFWFDNDYEALEYVRNADHDFMLMPRAYSIEMADSAIVRFQPAAVHIDFKFYTEEVVTLIKSNNARIWINALGAYDPAFGTEKEDEALEKILRYGANIIQTDQPELLLKLLTNKGLHP
jgi:glycerophosphoryl diester phosphodiesterase